MEANKVVGSWDRRTMEQLRPSPGLRVASFKYMLLHSDLWKPQVHNGDKRYSLCAALLCLPIACLLFYYVPRQLSVAVIV